MPAASPVEIVGAIIDAIQQSGLSAVLVSDARKHPRKFIVTAPDGTERSLWVYVWTLTPGGIGRGGEGRNLPNEYRIQMTSVTPPLELNFEGETVLIGYYPNQRLFAGFDLQRHRQFSTGSPSIQIDIRALTEGALQDGLAFYRKSNDEIAIGIRPDQFINYVANAERLHRDGRRPEVFELLRRATALRPISQEEIAALSRERQRTVQEVSRLSRDANFRQQVLMAYGNRCAVTRVQLRLVEAAHILPVPAPGSVDHVSNGIALSPTYHRAFDHGLIYLDERYQMRINRPKVADLERLHLTGGLETFRGPLSGIIYLPQDPDQRPNVRFITKANRFRQIRV